YERMDLIKTFMAGFVGTLAGLASASFLPPFNLAQSIFGGMTLLIPAMVITIATHELGNDAVEAGVVRLSYGLLRFVMLGAGIALPLQLWTLAFATPPIHESVPLTTPLVLALLVPGGAALVFCLSAGIKDAPWMIAAVLLAYSAQKLAQSALG